MLPLLERAAELRVPDGVAGDGEQIVEVVWTTGATVRRVRWAWEGPEEYDEELVVDPGSVRLGRLNGGAPFLDSHQGGGLGAVLGSVIPGSVRLEAGSGVARVRLTGAEDARAAVRRVLEKHVAISVGYRVFRYEVVRREGGRDLWRAVDWEPLEISAVAIPADAGARIRAERGIEAVNRCRIMVGNVEAADAAVEQEGGMLEQRIDAGVVPVVDQRGDAQVQEGAGGADEVEEVRRTAAEILRLCARHELGQEFAADLVGRGVSLDLARAAVLDRLAERDNHGARTVEPVPAQVRGGPDLGYRDAVSSALLHRYSPGEFELPAASREFRGLSLIELARHALGRAGRSMSGMSKIEVATEALLGRAGLHSTGDFPFILANVANKTLRRAYETTPRTFAVWARQRTIADFKPVSVTQLAGAPSLLAVPESGEFTYGTVGEGREVYGLLTYGRIVGITRQVLVNDDLDAFTRVPAAYGAAAADLESDIVYSILTGNPVMGDGQALFHASHGNLGTAGAISEASLSEAYRLFGAQRGLEGRLIGVLPRFIIVPPGARSVEARKNVAATTPDAVAGVNAFANRLEVVEEARLIPASGADPWFIAADPARIDTVEYAYLDGQQGVYTEVRQGFEVDGIEIKARHDFAAKAIDWRGLYRNAGV
ncbi:MULTISPECIES: prohead protease/major capsid protein fusion protein [unclassified Paracoccus (in: a-proteobacteria)]|uniref:prohead protease/major capsid protein fusion protein n=1 Tax=unclassified Paracoccus (in: a-proteobacteria) TaxID=2688777 RepID=UPI001E64B9E9|nr:MULTISPECIES: prohead protease/major capsid protein fusion protein [unclassified Paracoccus (in: a-proteobacteria)]UXU75542.1 peptidase U35 [Paracoccus sp. SMMA_5]UXU81447.1 peptidase U35 [Paracoccus sp. SMMA_5_TC]